MYPVILTTDEILCLRMMLRTVVARRTLEACSGYKLKIKALKPEEMVETVDLWFTDKCLRIQDQFRTLDINLFQAQHRSIEKKDSVVIALDQEAFTALRYVASQAYYSDKDSDAGALEVQNKIAKFQDKVKLAFENSELKSKTDATPNQLLPPPSKLMN